MPPGAKKSQPSNSGIVTDKAGERFIPESQRADGTTRKAIKIRPGFRPTEDVEVYRTRAAESRARGQRVGVPGLATPEDGNKPDASSSAAANKNAKRREARKKAKAAAEDEAEGGGEKEEENDSTAAAGGDKPTPPPAAAAAAADEAVVEDAEVAREKKARNLKKKLRQARELQNKKDDGEALLPEQIAKVIKINELVRELESLGFDSSDGKEAKDVKASAGKEGAEG